MWRSDSGLTPHTTPSLKAATPGRIHSHVNSGASGQNQINPDQENGMRDFSLSR